MRPARLPPHVAGIFSQPEAGGALGRGDQPFARPRKSAPFVEADRPFEAKTVVVDSAGVHFIVLMIPTKELVFADQVESAAVDAPAHYDELVESERAMARATQVYLDRHGIDFVDATVELQRCLVEGINPYDHTTNGHPKAAGHRAIAHHLLEALKQRELLRSN